MASNCSRLWVRRTTQVALSAILATSVLTLSAKSASAQDAKRILRVVPQADVKNLDPIANAAYITRNHGYLIWDTLFALDDKFQPQLQMLEKSEVSPDGLSYRLTLRDGLLWHDGAAVTADDCVASITRWAARDGMGQQIKGLLDSMSAPDAKTIEIKLKSPYPLLPYALGKPSPTVAFMMPKRLAETDPFRSITEMIGSGPYKFSQSEWMPGSKTAYVRNEAYKPRSDPPSFSAGGKVAKFDKVELDYFPDMQSAVAALSNGEVDLIEQLPTDYVDALSKAKGVKVDIRDDLGGQGWIRLNNLYPPFDNVKARQAVAALADQETYLRAIAGDPKFYKGCYAWFGCGSPTESHAGEDKIPHGIEKAKTLLKEAGYNGEKVVVLVPTDYPALQTATEVTISLFRKAGINVEAVPMDWATISSRRASQSPPSKGGWSVFHTFGVLLDIMLPPNYQGIKSGCKETGWFGWPCDAETEAMRSEFAVAKSDAERKAVIDKLNAHLNEVFPQVLFGQWTNPSAYRDNVVGLIPGPVPFYWNVEKR
jgi:peptide/nickel transport system substrate-binding protein